MKKSLFLAALLFLAVSGFANDIYNFNGYSDYWYPFGDPPGATQTYGEIFTVPDQIDNDLIGFSFFIGTPVQSGSIITGAYIATWTGQHAGQLVYSSPQITYDNVGDEEISVDTHGVRLQTGAQYVMFLSTSQYSGQSFGETHVVPGNTNPYLDGFAYFNNGSDFNELFTNNWDAAGLQPDWAVHLRFNIDPEPNTILLLGTGILGGIAVLRRKLF